MALPGSRALVCLAVALSLGCQPAGPPPDEAKLKWIGARRATAEELEAAARKYYPPASEDYFEDMDNLGRMKPDVANATAFTKLMLEPEEIKGRNAWVIWTGGNEAFWDWLSRHSYGSIDLLKLIDSRERGRRFVRRGAITEPGTRPPTEEETREAFGICYDRRVGGEGTADKSTVHVDFRKQEPPNPKIYGYSSGVVGLRLYPNPEFTGAAKERWVKAHEKEPDRYYTDPDYASRADTIRPFRVGMSCGFCHIAPHPLNPPADREAPAWANLSNNIGNQFMRFRAVFGNTLRSDNYLYHVLDAQLPGTIDTSLVASDNINNANTVNSFFGLPQRVARARHNPPEVIGGDTLAYLRDHGDPTFANPHYVPRVLLDGSDSVGVELALARVYLNIGTYHQQWVRLHNPLLGFSPQEPFKLKDVAENSLYWHATRLRVEPMKAFFLKATGPMRLKDAPDTPKKKEQLKNRDVPRHKDLKAGREVFARSCMACHSSIQPGDDLAVEAKLPDPTGLPSLGELPKGWVQLRREERNKLVPLEEQIKLARPRAVLRLRQDDLARLTRGDGTLPPNYVQWATQAVEVEEFWENNYLSTDARIPVTLTRTNSARAVATNALHGRIWEDFASQTYKELDSVGRIQYRDPFSLSEKSFQPLAGGPGYYRVPTLISIWATAPFLHNNALGTFNNDPSVDKRLEAFDDAIRRLLWPEERRKPTDQHVWDGQTDSTKPVPNTDSAQLDVDGGWVWRTSHDSWFRLYGHQVPTLLAGVTGWSSFWVGLVPWLPAIAFVLLGTLLFVSGSLISFRENLERQVPLLRIIFSPVRVILGLLFLVATIVAVVFICKHREVVEVLDILTMHSLPWLWLQALLVPLVFGGSVALLFFVHRLPDAGSRRRYVHLAGALCFIFAVVVAFTFGTFLSGRGGGIEFGPIPQGVPVNIIANMNPDAAPAERKAALKALGDFILEINMDGPKPGRKEFEERVAPALMNASKCPDFVTDRGHDFEFIRRMSDEDKQALIALLKTF